jgi:peptide/nickel transport system permease protein
MTATPIPNTSNNVAIIKGTPNWVRSLRRLRRHRMALFGAGLLVFVVMFVIVFSLAIPESASTFTDPTRRLEAPSAAHPFGTDQVGRDIFARVVYGGQISLIIGVTAVVLQILVGALVGLIAGYFGGIVGWLLMRLAEAMLAVPQLLIALLAVRALAGSVEVGESSNVTLLGREFSNTFIVLIVVFGLTSWMRVSRIMRSVVLSVKEQEYITAARSLGLTTRRIVLRHVLPNCTAPLIVSATLGVGNAILLEAYLGFLGLGVRPPTPTWGNIINEARGFLNQWYYWSFPAIFIILTVLGINLLGDGLRDALDPKSLK